MDSADRSRFAGWLERIAQEVLKTLGIAVALPLYLVFCAVYMVVVAGTFFGMFIAAAVGLGTLLRGDVVEGVLYVVLAAVCFRVCGYVHDNFNHYFS